MTPLSRSFASRACRALAQDDMPRRVVGGEQRRLVSPLSPLAERVSCHPERRRREGSAFQFLVYASFPMGSFLIRFPFSAKIAFATAGAIGGVAGSPTPPCESLDGTMCTSTFGI